MTITATIAGAISMLAQFGMFFGGHRDNNNGPGIIGSIAMMILAPLGAMLVQMAISRTREYAADNLGARIVGQPMWLASALVKIESAAHEIPNMEAERNPATAHHVHHQSAVGSRHRQSVLDASVDREPDRRAAAARCRTWVPARVLCPRRGRIAASTRSLGRGWQSRGVARSLELSGGLKDNRHARA